MKAAFIRSFNGIDGIEIGELPSPQIDQTEVLIKVKAAAVNPVDWKIVGGYLKDRMPYEFPLILGWDVAGVVEKMGSQVKDLKVGDEVMAYARKEIVKEGTFAEYVRIKSTAVVKKPNNLTFAQAAAIPLVTLTSYQALFDAADLKEKETILIHGGAGGVGSMAIQLAKWKKAFVITTASGKKHDYVKSLGADRCIDYTQENFVDKILADYPQGIDVVFNTFDVKDSYKVLKKGGRLISISAPAPQIDNINSIYVFVAPNGKQLQTISSLIEKGILQPPKIEEHPLQDVKEVLHKLKEGRTEGKLVLVIN